MNEATSALAVGIPVVLASPLMGGMLIASGAPAISLMFPGVLLVVGGLIIVHALRERRGRRVARQRLSGMIKRSKLIPPVRRQSHHDLYIGDPTPVHPQDALFGRS